MKLFTLILSILITSSVSFGQVDTSKIIPDIWNVKFTDQKGSVLDMSSAKLLGFKTTHPHMLISGIRSVGCLIGGAMAAANADINNPNATAYAGIGMIFGILFGIDALHTEHWAIYSNGIAIRINL